MTVASVPSQNFFSRVDAIDRDWAIPYALAGGAIGVEFGDMCYDSGTNDVALPAGQQASQGSLAADQVLFASGFCGCSLDKVQSTETNANRRFVVRVEGVKDFDCPSQVWVKGDLVGIYSDGVTSPNSQKVTKVTTYDKAIGVVIESSRGASVTTVTVYFVAKNYVGWKVTSASLGDVTMNSITAGDSSLDIAGKVGSSSVGGSVNLTGGAGHGATNAGGAVTITGGTGVTTGAGGALTFTGGVGGAGGAGGAVSMIGGAPTSGNAAGGAGALTGGAGSGTGAGGAIAVTGGASGSGATGNGGAVSMTGGAAASTNGTGGAASVVGGVATGTGTGGAVTITSGASAGASGTAGAVNIDCGAATGGTAGVISIGAANAASTKVGPGGSERAAIKAINVSGTIAVAVPSITDPDIAKVDVDVSAMTFAPAVGDMVIAIPLEALPSNARLQGAWVSATDTVQVTFGSEGGNVTGANKNFKFLFIDLT